MPRLYGSAFEDEHPGTLTLRHEPSDCVDVFYTPSQERVQLSGLGEDNTERYRVRLLQIDGQKKSLMVFPIRTTGKQDVFMKPKYPQVELITIEDQRHLEIDFEESPLKTQEDVMMLLEQLPSCFVKDFDWGLGLRQPYRFIIDAVEGLSDCTEVLITDRDETRIDDEKGIFLISLSDFTKIRKAIDRITRDGQLDTSSVNSENTLEFFAAQLGQAHALEASKQLIGKKNRSIRRSRRSMSSQVDPIIRTAVRLK